jgi:hypothetical protein
MLPTRAPARLASAAAALWGALLLSRPLAENDLFWHLMLGRAVARAGARTVPEPSALSSVSPLATVPEWLWDVLAWEAASVSTALLSLFVMGCGALAAWLIVRLVFAESRGAPWPLAVGLSALVLAATSVRFRERPETLALALAAASLLLGRRAVRRPRPSTLAGAVALAVTWAQVHGTFVLALPLFLAAALEHRTRSRRALLATAGLLALSLATGPHGLSVAAFVSDHLAGDAVRHIIDMSAPTWDDLDPARQPFHFIGVGLALVALVPAALGLTRRRPLALALLGVVLGLTSVRAVAWAVLCLVPQLGLVLRASRRRPSPRLAAALGAAGVLALALVTARFAQRVGPFLDFDLRATELPREGVAALASLPAGSVVWTSYGVGAAVGFLADGHLRVTIDSRTPLHFGDAEFALSRDCRARGPCFARAAEALHVEAAVVERGDECTMLARHGDFVPVAVNARYATFARRRHGLPALSSIDPCAPLYLSRTACEPGFAAELARLAPAGEDFLRSLSTLQRLHCGEPVEPAAADALLSRSPRWPAVRTAAGQAWLRAGQPDLAVERLLPLLEGGFPPAVPLLHEALTKLPPEARRARLDAVVATLDDRTPAPFRALRAITAAELDDVDVARVEAVRAAAAGEKSVIPVLRALARQAARTEEAAVELGWAELLEREAP